MPENDTYDFIVCGGGTSGCVVARRLTDRNSTRVLLLEAGGDERIEAVRKALKEITTPLIGSTITPVVVFLPLVAVSGVTGIFFRALAITMTAALLTSLALALTWTPSLSYVLLRERAPERDRAKEIFKNGGAEDISYTGEEGVRKEDQADERPLRA